MSSFHQPQAPIPIGTQLIRSKKKIQLHDRQKTDSHKSEIVGNLLMFCQNIERCARELPWTTHAFSSCFPCHRRRRLRRRRWEQVHIFIIINVHQPIRINQWWMRRPVARAHFTFIKVVIKAAIFRVRVQCLHKKNASQMILKLKFVNYFLCARPG